MGGNVQRDDIFDGVVAVAIGGFVGGSGLECGGDGAL
jgi:hypothetical protein